MFHYVYRITNKRLKKHYIGVRSSEIPPKKDLGHFYFSSSTNKEFILDQKQNKKDYEYYIIKEFKSRKESEDYEIFLLEKYNCGLDERFYNKSGLDTIVEKFGQ